MSIPLQYLIIAVIIKYTFSLDTNNQNVENENLSTKANIDTIDNHNVVHEVKSNDSKIVNENFFSENIEKNNSNKTWLNEKAKIFQRILRNQMKMGGERYGERLPGLLDEYIKIAEKVIDKYVAKLAPESKEIIKDYDAILAEVGHEIESAPHILSDIFRGETVDDLNIKSSEDTTTFPNEYYENGSAESEMTVSEEEVSVKDMWGHFPKYWSERNISLFEAMQILVNKSDSFSPKNVEDDGENHYPDFVEEKFKTLQNNNTYIVSNTSRRLDRNYLNPQIEKTNANNTIITKGYLPSNDVIVKSQIPEFDGEFIIDEMVIDNEEHDADKDIASIRRNFFVEMTDYEDKRIETEHRLPPECEALITWIHPNVDYPPNVDGICLKMLLWLTLDPVK